jgi:lysophospholipase L1-like esterase
LAQGSDLQQILVYSDSLAAERGCHFFVAGSVTSASAIDGTHLDADQHQVLGRSLARFVAALPGVLRPAAT